MQGIGTAPNGIGLLKRIISVAQKVLCGNDSEVEAKSTVYSKTYNEYCLNNSSDYKLGFTFSGAVHSVR